MDANAANSRLTPAQPCLHKGYKMDQPRRPTPQAGNAYAPAKRTRVTLAIKRQSGDSDYRDGHQETSERRRRFPQRKWRLRCKPSQPPEQTYHCPATTSTGQ